MRIQYYRPTRPRRLLLRRRRNPYYIPQRPKRRTTLFRRRRPINNNKRRPQIRPKRMATRNDHQIVNKPMDQANAPPLMPPPDIKVSGTPPTIDTVNSKSVVTTGANPNVLPYAPNAGSLNACGTMEMSQEDKLKAWDSGDYSYIKSVKISKPNN